MTTQFTSTCALKETLVQVFMGVVRALSDQRDLEVCGGHEAGVRVGFLEAILGLFIINLRHPLCSRAASRLGPAAAAAWKNRFRFSGVGGVFGANEGKFGCK
ncbi:hypothetical protein E2C01_095069 [Portunus trituberculatus]|uniref:Uncharacterized protein n=1 Tax=Portunus trituberculatus TaxID=210409 RepID=A0A5B7JU65_PORTR|nr:hypothetical protein [Portunus trituberculatus]